MRKYIDIRVTGESSELKDFLFLCQKLEYCGVVGASRTIPVVVDGDGSGRLNFEIFDDEDNLKEFPLLDKSYDEVIEKPHWIGE